MIQSLQDLPTNQHSQSSLIPKIMAEFSVLVSWQIPKWLPGFSSYSALYHKWDVKNGFTYVLQFFSIISDGLGGVILPSNIDKTLTTRTGSRFQLTLELEVEYLILISFLELAFFFRHARGKEQSGSDSIPTNFSSFHSFDVGGFS